MSCCPPKMSSRKLHLDPLKLHTASTCVILFSGDVRGIPVFACRADVLCAIHIRSSLPRNYYPDSWTKRFTNDTADMLRETCVTNCSQSAGSHEEHKYCSDRKAPQCHRCALPSPSYVPQEVIACTHVLFVVTEPGVNNRSVISTGIYFNFHVPVSSCVRHSLHNPLPSTSTFPSLQWNSPELLDTCLLHTFFSVQSLLTSNYCVQTACDQRTGWG